MLSRDTRKIYREAILLRESSRQEKASYRESNATNTSHGAKQRLEARPCVPRSFFFFFFFCTPNNRSITRAFTMPLLIEDHNSARRSGRISPTVRPPLVPSPLQLASLSLASSYLLACNPLPFLRQRINYFSATTINREKGSRSFSSIFSLPVIPRRRRNTRRMRGRHLERLVSCYFAVQRVS